jgi:Peptidase family M28
MPLRQTRLAITFFISFLLVASPCGLVAQTTPKVTQSLEENIRAELGFLASDAMQGRGSGTGFERIAAEYIGSQFRQFGLEPAGDVDSSGKKGFVQRVPLAGEKFVAAPVLTVSSGNDVKKWQYGRDLLVSFLRASRLDGDLQVIDIDGMPAQGAVVAIRLPDRLDSQKRQEVIRKARAAHAVAVVIPETEANRQTREAGDARLPNIPNRIQSDEGNNAPFAVFSLRKDVFDTVAAMPAGARVEFSGPTERAGESATWNAVGVLRGADLTAAKEAVMLSAHLDHLGVNEALAANGGDGIFNGADDDASGCVAVLELARALAAGKRPKRTIYFVCFGSEEKGGYGAQYFIEHAPLPLEQIVADVTFEMLGRPDAKVAPNTLWLTGYERSTLGPELTRQGALLVADPHPEQGFFQRSDNYTLALRGVVAHTVSSFGLHGDYHRASDEVSKIDFAFMTQSINSLIGPIRWLADSSFRPTWLPGKAPVRG